MSAEYVKKVNDKPLAASEVAPTSPLKTTIEGKVSKSGDTMSGRLTLQKTLSQVITGTGTAATSSGSPVTYYPAKWKYDLGIATPVAGDQMVIQLPVAGSDYGVYLSTDNGTTYYPVAMGTGSTRCTTRYPSGAYVCVVFETFVSGNNNAGRVTDIYPVAGGTSRTTVTTGCWRIVNDYDSGNTYDRTYNAYGRFYAGATGCSSYSLVCLDNTGKYSKLISSGTGTGNTKTVNTSGKFVFPSSVLYYAADNTVAANTLVTSTYATYIAYPAVDMRYSTNYNTSSNPAFTTNSPVYIECNINSDGTWSPTEKAITQTLVSGKYYIFLGITYSTAYHLSLAPNHPIFYYDGTNLVSALLTKGNISASSTNGNINVGGTDVTVYTHPTKTAYSAKGSATKVPKITTDSTGHVTSIEEVTISGVTPASHSHGNIANGGTLTDTAAAAAGNDYVVIRDADNSKIQTSTIKGTDVADAVSKKHSHSTLTLSTTAQAYDGTHTLALPSSDPYTSARTPASHTHGNIQNGGTLQTTDVAIANGDKLVVTDASDSNKIARSSVSFDGSTTTKALTQKGTFESFATASDISTAIQALDVSSAGGDGKYISAISETDGKISATATTMDTTPTASSTNAVTSGGIKTALDGKSNTGHTHSNIVTEGDNRNVATVPNDYSSKLVFKGLKAKAAIDNPSSDTYSYLVGLRGWDNSSGGNAHELAFNNTGIFARSGSTTTWGAWKKVLTSNDLSAEARTIPQDISKGANLVVNGSGILGTNYNFSSATFLADTDLPTGVAGCFHRVANNTWSDEVIAINTDKTYLIEAWYRVKTASTSTVRLSTMCLDIDKNPIEAVHICYGVGTLTTLSQDLNPGDTVVHLTDLSGANWLSNTSYHRGFIFWNYRNSYGYLYPPETYSRNYYPSSDSNPLWDVENVNVSAGTITLNNPWSGPKILAGTPVSRRSSGSTYYYAAYSSSAGATTTWSKLSGQVKGFVTPGYADGGAFRPGTAFIRVGWVNSNTNNTEWIDFAGIELRENPSAFNGVLPVSNGGTGATTKKAAEYAINGGMAQATASMADNFQIVFSRVGSDQSATNGVFIYRTALTVWNYIKDKISSVLGLTATSYGGNAATATSAGKLTTARKTYVTLGTASTTTTRDWSGDTTIPVDGTLAVSHGGTGLTSVTSNSFLVGNGTGALVEKTPAQVLSLIGAQGAMTEMTTQEVTDFINDLGDL